MKKILFAALIAASPLCSAPFLTRTQAFDQQEVIGKKIKASAPAFDWLSGVNYHFDDKQQIAFTTFTTELGTSLMIYHEGRKPGTPYVTPETCLDPLLEAAEMIKEKLGSDFNITHSIETIDQTKNGLIALSTIEVAHQGSPAFWTVTLIRFEGEKTKYSMWNLSTNFFSEESFEQFKASDLPLLLHTFKL